MQLSTVDSSENGPTEQTQQPIKWRPAQDWPAANQSYDDRSLCHRSDRSL